MSTYESLTTFNIFDMASAAEANCDDDKHAYLDALLPFTVRYPSSRRCACLARRTRDVVNTKSIILEPICARLRAPRRADTRVIVSACRGCSRAARFSSFAPPVWRPQVSGAKTNI